MKQKRLHLLIIFHMRDKRTINQLNNLLHYQKEHHLKIVYNLKLSKLKIYFQKKVQKIKFLFQPKTLNRKNYYYNNNKLNNKIRNHRLYNYLYWVLNQEK